LEKRLSRIEVLHYNIFHDVKHDFSIY